MSTIKVDTIATRTGSGNITASNTIAGTSATLSGTLAVTGDATFDTTTLKVDSSNNRVGIGTASPTSDLHVSGGAGAHVAIQSSAGSHWRLGDAVGSSNGIFVVRDHTNSANRIQILADGKTQIAQGVTFGSDTAAANTLDDYEEGSFTPNIGGSGVSYGTQAGVYRKIGSLVFVYIQMSVNTIGSPATTSSILGLPFAPAISNQHFGIAYGGGLTNSYYSLWGNFRSDSTIRFDRKNTLGTGQSSGVAVWQNGAAIYGSGCYYTT